ncbi:MAG TPA: cytochrome c [Myxococcota bacterium]|jgi:mono/diheme cytochrome c family protein|nr:cytochrome c [Myxococcota bacterium]
MGLLRGVSFVTFCCGTLLAAHAATAQEVTVAEVGKDYFERYCSGCHGLDGKGDGPFASYLKTPPPDLTTLAKRNGGVFPDQKVAAIVDGRDPRVSHGTREMPIWGERFGTTMGGDPFKQSAIRGQVALFVAYLRSIQQK